MFLWIMVSENTESLKYINNNGTYDNNYNLYNNDLETHPWMLQYLTEVSTHFTFL